MRILAIDLGKFRFTAVLGVDSRRPTQSFRDVSCSKQSIHDLVVQTSPDLVVIEVCPMAGTIADLMESLGVRLAVLNTCDDRVKRRDSKAKTDLRDAQRMLELAFDRPDELPTVAVPDAATRRWRRAIGYRTTIQQRLVAVKNSLRALFLESDIRLPSERAAWSKEFRAELLDLATSLPGALRAIAKTELSQLTLLERQLKAHTKQLDEIAAKDERVQTLRGVFGVGTRVAEAFVAWIGDAARFANGKQVGSYFGLDPRVHCSGETSRYGSITKSGSSKARWLLIQAAWVASRRKEGWAGMTMDRISRGLKARRRIAATAVARQLAVRMWAMLRDGTRWNEPSKTLSEADRARAGFSGPEGAQRPGAPAAAAASAEPPTRESCPGPRLPRMRRRAPREGGRAKRPVNSRRTSTSKGGHSPA